MPKFQLKTFFILDVKILKIGVFDVKIDKILENPMDFKVSLRIRMRARGVPKLVANIFRSCRTMGKRLTNNRT